MSYSFSEGPNADLIRIWPKFGHFCLLFSKFFAGLIRMRVLFEGGFLSRIYGILNCDRTTGIGASFRTQTDGMME